MIVNLVLDHHLRGCSFEHVARMLLRRHKKNNFIFCLRGFDSIDEVLSKYRLDVSNFADFIGFLREEWRRCDLLEFVLDNKRSRKVVDIIVYDVKTRYFKAKHDLRFEFCKSNFLFMNRCKNFGVKAMIISMILFDDWRFSFNIKDFSKTNKRVYSQFKKK